MKMPFFASFIIFIIWLAYELSKGRRRAEKNEYSFWEKEAEANRTRRKSLDDLKYISIPFDSLPMHVLQNDDKIAEYHQVLYALSDSPIVNFTGISNTDLKLKYGAPNLNLLMRYDENYTSLVGTLHKWAMRLYEAGYIDEAKSILEFAVCTDTDVSGTYRLLASIYTAEGHPEKIADLLQKAEQLKSGSKDTIVRILQESDR
ncbi:MAG: hypothetical protein GX235_02805 [Clostridiales bacterium]|nr:hypothetical protein [Clostridiales bacterium]